ncbi:hypothetical protein PCANC_06555 [Puccinia coronata f. sp. avenae]|uniref:Uncharacterized protein n=1 Tax=Puccinia coronata f. sp. avenae TaxID=200324 RepID=A0A2N5VA11_9BASI|nr:hypothetical protein PCANC_06555 [Puccinia coronata f. sp. avenae]
MENGSDSPNPQPIHEKIIHHLVLIEKAVAGVDERIHASVGDICARDTGIKSSVTPGGNFDRITTMEQFFPISGSVQSDKEHIEELKALENLSFEEKALMSSSTFERNECYHGALRELYEYESYAVKEVLREVSPVNRNAFFEALDRRIVGHPHYKILQAQLLRLRMKRYRVQALVVGLERRKQSGSKGGGESVIGPVA